MAYARSVRYLQVTSGRERMVVLLPPLYALLHFTVLLPLRLYSLATLHRTGWGTRQTVEVASVVS